MPDSTLSEFVETVCSDSHLRVQEDLGDGYVRLRSEEAERRQAAHDIRCSEDIVIEMLRNSRDADARHIFLATWREGSARHLVIIDDGSGIPAHLHDLVFEPRVTSKLDTMHIDKWGVHGRGMALYSVKANADSAQVRLSEPGKGTSIAVKTDVSHLQERKDQSTFPQLVFNEDGKVSVRGPRNILRTSCEFALAHRKDLEVYVGSPAEIASTLYHLGVAGETPASLAFKRHEADAPFVKLLAYSADAAEFADRSEDLGLPLSQRSAYRIMGGEVPPLDSLREMMEEHGVLGAPSTGGSSTKQKTAKQRQAVVLSPDDVTYIQDMAKRAFSEVASAYYLESDVEVSVKVDRGSLRISIPLVEEES